MKYLKVNPEHDQKKLNNTIYIKNELFTAKEAEKLGVKKEYCSEITVSCRNTYFLFGARFEKTL